MSTILRALQKVEKDTTEETTQFGTTQTIRAAHTISRGVTAQWYLQRGKHVLKIGGAVAIVCLILFGLISLLKNDNAVDPASQADRSQIAPPSANNQKIVENRGPSRPKSYSPAPTYDPNHQPGRYAIKGDDMAASQRGANIRPEGQNNPSLETETISPSADNEDFYADPNVETADRQEPEEVLESDPEAIQYAKLNVLEDGKLELQAISYAKTPAERMAVMNNEIIREGRSLAGYKIIYIGPEMVVVDKGGIQWRVIFMAR